MKEKTNLRKNKADTERHTEADVYTHTPKNNTLVQYDWQCSDRVEMYEIFIHCV